MADDTLELQASTTAWQIAMQEILRMVVRDLYQSHGEVAFTAHIKRLEEGAVDSIYSDLRLRGTNEWTETLVKEKATNIVTNLLTSFTFEHLTLDPGRHKSLLMCHDHLQQDGFTLTRDMTGTDGLRPS